MLVHLSLIPSPMQLKQKLLSQSPALNRTRSISLRDLCPCYNNLFLMQELAYTDWLEQLELAESALTEGMSFVAICLAFG